MREVVSPEVAYKRNEGFLLVNDIGHKAMSMAAVSNISEINPHAYSDFSDVARLPLSFAGLHMVAQSIDRRFPNKLSRSEQPPKTFGVSRREMKRENNHFNFAKGFGDMNFTWHFAPLVAGNVVDTFVEGEMMRKDERDNLALGDWADMIGSYWFSDLIHDLALTTNGLYGDAGRYAENYQAGSYHSLSNLLKRSLFEHNQDGNMVDGELKLFDTDRKLDIDTGMTYLTASVSSQLRKLLRDKLKADPSSVGCPVARRAGTLPEGVARGNKHLATLVENGMLVLDDAKDGKVRFRQEYTPIDRALDAVAQHLDVYDQQYGMPYFTSQSRKIEHKPYARTGALHD